jgi:hypothetical protein
MKALLKNILFQSKSNTQVLLSTIGAFIGMIALMFSVLLLNDIKSFQNSDDDLLSSNSVIIQKKVTKFTTIGLNSTEFSLDEIETLKQKEFIEDVAPFQSANYGVGISEYPNDGLPPFYADMFFQSIPNEFIDVETEWDWNENSDFVPIILPRDFLMLINYGIAESQGLPQISEDLLSIARLKIHMNGKSKRGKITGKVVGFSQKISSVLVPESFLNYSNELYGSKSVKLPQRLFIKVKKGSYGQLESLMNDMNLDIKKSALDLSKIKTFVNVIILVFLIFAILIILLSIFGFVQYIQLLLNKAKQDIVILNRIGYQLGEVLKVMLIHFSKVFSILTIIASATVLIVKFLMINPLLQKNGIEVANNQIGLCLLVAFLSVIGFVLLNYQSIKVTLKNINN